MRALQGGEAWRQSKKFTCPPDIRVFELRRRLGLVTAAMQPSIEDVLMSNIPELPKLHLHSRATTYENGDDFMQTYSPSSGERRT